MLKTTIITKFNLSKIMQIKIKSKVDSEGRINLVVPKYLANQELEVIILYDTLESLTPTPEELGYPVDFFQQTAGKWEGEPLTRGEQGECDQRNWDL
jgi:hypothetical protein